MSNKPEYLECQQCGWVLRELTPVEAQKVAQDPYNFIFYCNSCIKDIEKAYEIESYL